MKKNSLWPLLRVVLSGLLLVGSVSTTALARPVITNYIGGTVRADGDFSLYDYTAGATATYTSQADFATGSTMVGTSASPTPATGSVLLSAGVANGAWWNALWTGRQCFTVDHTAVGTSTVTEYPVSVAIDTAALIPAQMKADGSDLRAISADGNIIPIWLEGPINTTTSVVWAQIPTITAGATTWFCLYYGNAAATSVSDPLAPFTYTSLKNIYYPVNGNAAASILNVATFGAGNSVKTGTTTLSLATAGATGSFATGDATPTGPVQVKGPINGRATLAGGIDSIVPISFAGTNFVVPILSKPGTQIDIFSPFAAATVTVVVTQSSGAAISNTVYNVAAGASVTTPAFPNNAGTAVVTSTKPVLLAASNTATTFVSQIPMPAAATSWYGVTPTSAEVSFAAPGNATWIRSNGATGTSTATIAGQRLSLASSGTATNGGAAADGVVFTSSQPIEPILKSGDAATFMPLNELSNTYVLPLGADYVAFTCPTVGTQIMVGAAGPFTCTTTGAGPFPLGTPGKGVYNPVPDIAVGSMVSSVSGAPFYMYYAEPGGSETSIWGPKQGRQFTYPTPIVAPVTGGLGTWESAPLDTTATGTRTFGMLSWSVTTAGGTAVSLKVASASATIGPWTYVGPDGTVATSYTTSPLPIPFAVDGPRYFRIQAILVGSGGLSPSLNDVTATYNLPRLAHTTGSASTVSFHAPIGVSTTGYLVRVRTGTSALPASTATLKELGTSSGLGILTSAVARFETGAVNQVVIASGVVTTSVGLATLMDSTAPRSIVVTANPSAAGTAVIRTTMTLDVGAPGGSPFIENDIDLTILSP